MPRVHSPGGSTCLSEMTSWLPSPKCDIKSKVRLRQLMNKNLPDLICRVHSFPRNVEFWAKPRNLPISVELLCFHGILRNSLLDSDKGTNTAYFDRVWPLYCMYTWFHHEIHDCQSGFDGRNTENIELSLSEILPVNSVSVSSGYRRQIRHIWSGSEAIEN